MIWFWIVCIVGFISIWYMSKDIIKYARTRNLANRQSKNILELIKQEGRPCAEPTFSTNVQPDFSGYFD